VNDRSTGEISKSDVPYHIASKAAAKRLAEP
jgi:hypothetical protein